MCGILYSGCLLSLKKEALLCSAAFKACTKSALSMVTDKANAVNMRLLPFKSALTLL